MWKVGELSAPIPWTSSALLPILSLRNGVRLPWLPSSPLQVPAGAAPGWVKRTKHLSGTGLCPWRVDEDEAVMGEAPRQDRALGFLAQAVTTHLSEPTHAPARPAAQQSCGEGRASTSGG